MRGEEPSLVLDSVVYEDEGGYECTAYNYIGDKKHSTKSRPIQVRGYKVLFPSWSRDPRVYLS
jgi:hypothetical protein